MGAATVSQAADSGKTSGIAMLGVVGALTLIASARITAPRVACRAEPITAAAAAAAAAAKAAAVGKAASAATGAAKAGGAVTGSAGAGTLASGEEEIDPNFVTKKWYPKDRGTPEYEKYMRQLRAQKKKAWEDRTNPDGRYKKGDSYDPFSSGEETWLDNTRAAGLYAGEFDPAMQVGATDPLGFFDPLGFCPKGDKAAFSNFRAAEIKHGRVAMMAALGGVVQHYVQLPGFKTVPTGLNALNVPPGSYGFIALVLISGYLELAVWTESPEKEPGNFGDPLSFDQYTEDLRNRELNNGRFAMFAALGIIAAELLTGKDAIEQLGLK